MIVGIGYVGSVHGDRHCDTDGHINIQASYRGNEGETCIRTVHAEVNAVLKCMVRGSKEDGFIECYSTHQPCCECLKMLLQIGVRRIFFIHQYEDTRRDTYLRQMAVEDIESKIHFEHIPFVGD